MVTVMVATVLAGAVQDTVTNDIMTLKPNTRGDGKMGGSIGVTIRTPDGEIHKMERWTNSTYYTFTDPKFMAGDPDTLKEYLDTWYEMCKSYDDGTYKEDSPMAGIYCDPDGSRDKMTPSEYGLVYIDFVNKLFVNMNGYTSYDKVSDAKIQTLIMNRAHDEWDRNYLERIYTQIKGFSVFDKDKREYVETPIKFGSVLELAEHADPRRKPDIWSEYNLDMGDWEYISFADDQEGAQEFLALLDERGIELTAEERKGFDQFRVYEEEEDY